MTLPKGRVDSTRKKMISILLIDDQAAFRDGLQNLLNFYNSTGGENFQVVGRAASVEQALKLSKEQHPALVLLDLGLGQEDGIDFLTRYSDKQPQGKVLVLSGQRDDEWVFKAMQAGARGFVFKQSLSKQLSEAIQTVMNEQIYLTPELLTGFFRHFHFHAGRSLKVSSSLHLTDRELEVLACLVKGDSNAVISQRLHITVGTVKAYLRCIFEKMGVDSRTQAALKALKLGLV
ncbi:response regulator transcription factor [cf. Phormidesmis sp. LEGE 11477]|nr:response regulator transcription factor [cf. Phormidesmis sp. LEGE 11477]